MSWNNLSMKERASYIRMGVENGITDLDTIREVYNKFAEGGPVKKSNYYYADSDTTDPNFTDLTPIGEGVYKNKFGKVVYDTTKVTPPEKEKSINDNWQKAYAKGIPSGTMASDIETMNAVTGGALNLIIPSQVVGAAIHSDKPQDYFLNLLKGNNGIVTDNFSKKHPYWSIAANGLFDGIAFGTTGILKNPQKLSSIAVRDLKNLPNSENLMYHLDFGNNVGAFSKNGAFIKDGLLYPGAAKDINQKSFIWFNKGKPYTTSIRGKKLNRAIIANEDDINGLLKVRDSTEPIGQWNGSSGFVLPSEYVTDIPFNTNKGLIYNRKQLPLIGEFWLRDFKYAKGGPIKKSYKDFSTRLSKAWNNQDLSKDDYDYQKYYNDDPGEAYRQLESIEHGGTGHFPDGGKSGTYKTPNHPTYPDLGANSWLNGDKIFNMSARQAVPENTDRVLDYLGSDLDYNRGATKVMYDGAYQLPEVTITPNGNYTELIPNELGTGWMYRDRAGRFDDVDYSYLDNYLGNKKSLGGNLYGNGGSKPRYRSSSNIRKQISTWEGATMKTNTPFEKMDTMFNQVLPEGALEKLSQEQLDGLYSFAYNVGTGRFKTRTAPTLAKYLQGDATLQDVQNAMWASGDKKYRGLANRRQKERSMLGAYVPVQETIPLTTPIDITPAAQPIIESNPVIQGNIETLPLAFNTESQEEPDYTPGFLNYVNYINQIRQPKQRDRRIWLAI